MQYQERLIDLLDRKYRLVVESPPGAFLLEMESFVDFIMTEETLRGHVGQLVDRLARRWNEYKRELEELKKQLVQIREDFAALCPQEDDSSMRYQTDSRAPPAEEYQWSLARFDDIVNGAKCEGVKLSSGPGSPQAATEIATLVDILTRKIQQPELFGTCQQLGVNIEHLTKRLAHLERGYRNYCLVSPGCCLLLLRHMADKINPRPRRYASWSDLTESVMESWASLEGGLERQIQSAVYDGAVNVALIETLKAYLRRAYEGIRAAIGSHLMYSALLQRYKARCMWYDRQRVTGLVKRRKTTAHPQPALIAARRPERRKNEESLTRDLALFLFDNGISTLYRVKRGVHEYDLVGNQTENPIFVEAKVYEDSRQTRSRLITGFNQLAAYLNALEAANIPIREAYYVVYRLGGPLYMLLSEVPLDRLTVYTVLIDLGSSKESGSHQPRTIQIEKDDLVESSGNDD